MKRYVSFVILNVCLCYFYTALFDFVVVVVVSEWLLFWRTTYMYNIVITCNFQNNMKICIYNLPKFLILFGRHMRVFRTQVMFHIDKQNGPNCDGNKFQVYYWAVRCIYAPAVCVDLLTVIYRYHCDFWVLIVILWWKWYMILLRGVP